MWAHSPHSCSFWVNKDDVSHGLFSALSPESATAAREEPGAAQGTREQLKPIRLHGEATGMCQLWDTGCREHSPGGREGVSNCLLYGVGFVQIRMYRGM